MRIPLELPVGLLKLHAHSVETPRRLVESIFILPKIGLLGEAVWLPWVVASNMHKKAGQAGEKIFLYCLSRYEVGEMVGFESEFVNHQAAAKFGLEPCGFRGHDISRICNAHDLVHAHGVEGQGHFHFA